MVLFYGSREITNFLFLWHRVTVLIGLWLNSFRDRSVLTPLLRKLTVDYALAIAIAVAIAISYSPDNKTHVCQQNARPALPWYRLVRLIIGPVMMLTLSTGRTNSAASPVWADLHCQWDRRSARMVQWHSWWVCVYAFDEYTVLLISVQTEC